MKKPEAGNTALFIGMFGAAATICAALIGAGATILGPAIANRQASLAATPTAIAAPPPTDETPWAPGSDHPEYPHVVASAIKGVWEPERGYDWVSSEAGDYRVVWTPGLEHPTHPNVVSGEEEGDWYPASGYKWVDADDDDNWEVVPILGEIENVEVEHNVEENGQNGMRLHIRFTVDQMQEIRCNIGAYFFYANGVPLEARAGDTAHMAGNGNLAVAEDFTPPYESTSYSDYKLFVPYEIFNIDPAIDSVEMKFKVRLYNWRDKSIITESGDYSFTYSH